MVAPQVSGRGGRVLGSRLRARRRSRPPILGHGPRGRSGDGVARGLRAREPGPARSGGTAAVVGRAREALDRVRRGRHARHRPDGQHLAARIRRSRRDRAGGRGRHRLGRVRPGQLRPGHGGHERARGAAVRRSLVRGHAGPVLSPRPVGQGRLRRATARLGRMAANARPHQASRWREPLRGAAAAQRGRAARRALAAAGRAAPARRRPLGQLPQRGLQARGGALSVHVRAAARASGHQQRDRQRLERVRPRLFQLLHLGPLADRRVQEAASVRAAGVLDDGPAAWTYGARRIDRRRLQPGHLPALAAEGGGLEAGGVPLPSAGAAGVLQAHRQPARAALGLGRPAARARPLCPRLPRPTRPGAPGAAGAGVGAHCHRAQAGDGEGRARRPLRPPAGRGDGCARRRHPREAPLDARQKGESMKASSAAWLFVAPALLAIAVFFVVPVMAALLMSATDFDIYGLADLRNVRFIGLDNYLHLLQRPLFWRALFNTLFFVLVGVPLSIAVSLAAALLLNSPLARLKGLYRTALFVPVVTTLAAVAVGWRFLLHTRYGPPNYGPSSLGLSPVDWLGGPRWAMPAIVLLTVWENFGFNIIILLPGLQAIPFQPYRAARP